MSLIYGFFLSTAIAGLALWHASLTPFGAIGAVIVGTLTFGLGGPAWGVLLALFFVTSSALSHFRQDRKQAVAESFAKGNRRDLGQVLANGALAALLATLNAVIPWSGFVPLYIGVIASVNADTWATELGTLSPAPPRLITTGRVVPVGTSGGISLLGLFTSLTGAALIGLTAGLLFAELTWWTGLLLGSVAGLFGSLFDSWLGATVQGMYFCDHCQKATEASIHTCGRRARLLVGWSWMSNDLVNLLASIAGALMALALWALVPFN